MASQWQNFLQNLGEWRGSFATFDTAGTLLNLSPSVLTLESEEEGRLVRFGLRRWPADVAVAPGGGPVAEAGAPSRDIQQDYRSLGRQVVFFEPGTFCKGSLQVAPVTTCGGEFGFIGPDRRPCGASVQAFPQARSQNARPWTKAPASVAATTERWTR